MLRKHVRRSAVVLVLFLALGPALTGCSLFAKRPTAPGQPIEGAMDPNKQNLGGWSDEPTSGTVAQGTGGLAAANALAAPATGPIYTPAVGSAVRNAIMNAIISFFGGQSGYTVRNINVQGDTAIADVTTPQGKQIYVALRRYNGAWRTVWNALHGTASNPDLGTAVPAISPELRATINWEAVRPVYEAPRPIDVAPTAGTASAAGLAAVKAVAPANAALSVDRVRLAQDLSGNWYSSVRVVSATGAYATVTVYQRISNGVWGTMTIGAAGSVDAVLPPEVASKL